MMLVRISLFFQTLGLFYFSNQSDDNALAIGMCTSFFLVVSVIVFIVWMLKKNAAERLRREQEETANLSPEEKAQYYENKQERAQEYHKTILFGQTSPAMICPHCQTKGQVRTKKITQKKGVSGGKATGAILTGGISLLATGLSRTEVATQAHCDNCSGTWYF